MTRPSEFASESPWTAGAHVAPASIERHMPPRPAHRTRTSPDPPTSLRANCETMASRAPGM